MNVRQSSQFERWLQCLSDRRAKARIEMGLRRVQDGNLGEYRSLGGGLFEFKIDYGPGYRLYFTWRGRDVVFLLAGGDKQSQERDIEAAQDLVKSVGL